ncbi:unnamed protein product [Phytophthora fragariaefolia]|uniref:Unnamed protein product n=1 Tax=Phytophthora fragariaefolia TaxID=1490495 RepID=A0A9W6X468_9STRA|nr:unnamed protein product [Phytophthora fragariaefolia]
MSGSSPCSVDRGAGTNGYLYMYRSLGFVAAQVLTGMQRQVSNYAQRRAGLDVRDSPSGRSREQTHRPALMFSSPCPQPDQVTAAQANKTTAASLSRAITGPTCDQPGNLCKNSSQCIEEPAE